MPIEPGLVGATERLSSTPGKEFATFGFAASLLVLQAAAAQALPTAVACSDENHAALDFWVGEWDVYRNGNDALVAHSTIEKLYEGCAIREHWMPLGGKQGGSLSGYDPATGRWHQTWIGSTAGVVFFEGGVAEGKLVLTGWWPGSGPNGEDGLTRMTYSRAEDGAVRQLGEFSADQGLTWGPSFDFIYRPRAPSGD